MKKEIYTYSSNTIDHSKVGEILQEISDLIIDKGVTRNSMRKVFAVISECLENVCNHGYFDKKIENSVNFSVFMKETELTIIAKNCIKNSSIQELQNVISFLNALPSNKIKPYFQKIIKEKSLASKGGAGIGLIIIKRKIVNPIKISIEPLDKKISLITFTLEFEIGPMKTLEKSATKHTPEIDFSLLTQKFILRGQSRPENADEFYSGIISWIEVNSSVISKLTKPVLVINLDYFNSASLKNILRLLRMLITLNHENFEIEWYYENDDEASKEEGIELSEILNKKFNFIEK